MEYAEEPEPEPEEEGEVEYELLVTMLSDEACGRLRCGRRRVGTGGVVGEVCSLD